MYQRGRRRARTCLAMSVASSSAVHASFRIAGSSWLCHRSRHCLPLRPGRYLAISAHRLAPSTPRCSATSLRTVSSSSCVHGRCAHGWRRSRQDRPRQCRACMARGRSHTLHMRCTSPHEKKGVADFESDKQAGTFLASASSAFVILRSSSIGSGRGGSPSSAIVAQGVWPDGGRQGGALSQPQKSGRARGLCVCWSRRMTRDPAPIMTPLP